MDFCVREYVFSSLSLCVREPRARARVCACVRVPAVMPRAVRRKPACPKFLACHRKKARYLLLVTLLDVIIVCPRQLRHESPAEGARGGRRGAFEFFLACTCPEVSGCWIGC